MIRDFGLLLAVGIAVICVASIVLPLAMLGIREFKSPTKIHDFKEGALGRLTVKLGELPARLAPPLIIASVAIFVGGIIVEDKLTLETDPVRWVNQSSQTIKDIHSIERETGSSNELGVFVRSDADLFTDENMAYVHEFSREQLEANEDVLRSVASIEEVVGGRDHRRGRHRPRLPRETTCAARSRWPRPTCSSSSSPRTRRR